MAKVQNTFLKSKMNKDLDARLLPNGEYRDARNAQISKSEGPQVGNLENVLGNKEILNIRQKTNTSNLLCIGSLPDEVNNTVYLFLTNNLVNGVPLDGPPFTIEPNPDGNYVPSAENFILSYNVLTGECTVLVRGAFLNFYEKNLIIGLNIMEGLLFFTDNRNQPRVINVNLANSDSNNINPTYYTTEDQISVAKYNPYEAIELYQESVLDPGFYETTMKDVSSKFLPNGGSAEADGAQTGGLTTPLIIDNVKGQINTGSNYTAASVFLQNTAGELIDTGKTVTSFIDNAGTLELEITSDITVSDNQLIVFEANPYYDSNFSGDPDYLEDKFVRFSYRFKFVDNEYSIFAPFTQIAFIPKQDGYFMKVLPPNEEKNDQKEAYQSTVVYFVENKINNIDLRIPLPFTNYTLQQALKISEIEILYKESDGVTVKSIESVPISTVANSSGIALVNGVQTPTPAGVAIDIDNIEGGIQVGATVEGPGVPANTTVTSFTPDDPSNPISGELKVNNAIANLDDNILLIFGDINYFTYSYDSTKPIKTLPESELVRVYDKVPLKALAQEVSGNRVIYGNFLNRLDPPSSIDYNVACTPKFNFDINQITATYTGAATTITAGTIIPVTITKLLDPPAGVFPGMTITSTTFGTIIPSGTIITTTSESGQSYSAQGISASASTTTEIILSFIDNPILIGMSITGTGVPALTTVVNYNEATGQVIANQAVSIAQGAELSFTQTGSLNIDITLNQDITVASSVVFIMDPGGDVLNYTSKVEYPNHSVKTNRNYQVGFVLSDRYGRQSGVILSDNKRTINLFGLEYTGSTLYSAYIPPSLDQASWPGNSLKVLVNSIIDLGDNSYNDDVTSVDYNPTGWYSYKIVVKQTEQDYYNVYLPGIMNSYPVDTSLELDNTAHIVLINDNINKIPRDLNEVGPDQKQFGSSIQLYGRVQNTANTPTGNGDLNEQYYLERSSDTASVISTVYDLFDFDPIKPPTPNFFPQFYSLDSNPLVARITTDSGIGQIASTEYFTVSGKALKAESLYDVIPGAALDADMQNFVCITQFTGDLSASGITGYDLVSSNSLPDKVYVSNAAGNVTPIETDYPTNSSGIDSGLKIKLVDNNNDPFFFVPVEDEIITITKTTGNTTPPLNRKEVTPGIQRLAVYETEPVESALDIYWETSTCGLIRDLNDAILNNQQVPGASDLFPFNLTPFTEGLAPNGNILQSPFGLVNNFGGTITLDPANGDEVTLLNCFNGLGQQVAGDAINSNVQLIGDYFELDDTSGAGTGPWNIKTTSTPTATGLPSFNDVVFFGYNSPIREFTFRIKTVVDGIENIIQKQANLGNEPPLYRLIKVNAPDGTVTEYGPGAINPIPIPPNDIIAPFRRTSNPAEISIAEITVENGEATSGQLQIQDLKFVGSNINNSNLDFQIFDQRRGSPNGPLATNTGNGALIFSLDDISDTSLTGDEKIGNLIFTDPDSLFISTVPADVYYVTIRIQDAGTFEDVRFAIDLRISLNGGENGNIFNLGFRQRTANSTGNTMNTSCYSNNWAPSAGRNSKVVVGGTSIIVDSSTVGIAPSEKGRYFYANGFFNSVIQENINEVGPMNSFVNEALGANNTIQIPFINRDQRGFLCQRQTLWPNNASQPKVPLIKATATISSVGTQSNDTIIVDIDPSSIQINSTAYPAGTLANEALIPCMRAFKSWPVFGSSGFLNTTLRNSRYNRIISYNNSTGRIVFTGSSLSQERIETGWFVGDKIYFYGGPIENANPWFFASETTFGLADDTKEVIGAYFQFSEWSWFKQFRDNSTAFTNPAALNSSDVQIQQVPAFPTPDQVAQYNFSWI